MKENPNNPVKLEGAESTVPKIFQLLQRKASTEDVVQELYAEYYSPTRDPERLFLGFQGLQQRGLEGEAALRHLASGSDSFAALVNKVLMGGTTSQELEETLGVKRWDVVLNPLSKGSNFVLYEEALKRGYTKMTAKEFARQPIFNEPGEVPDQVSLSIDKDLTTRAATFGIEEPMYCELVGPQEFLRLRTSAESANFLLLGTLGHYSADEFTNYTKKINSRIKPLVIDISDAMIKMASERKSSDAVLIKGDAKSLPFKDQSLDHIYTNFLFDRLYSIHPHFSGKFMYSGANGAELVFQNTYRALRPGGSFVFCERSFGVEKLSQSELKGKLVSLGLKQGFEITRVENGGLIFPFVKERGSTVIDSNGFPQYGHSLLARYETKTVAGRFTKPK